MGLTLRTTRWPRRLPPCDEAFRSSFRLRYSAGKKELRTDANAGQKLTNHRSREIWPRPAFKILLA
jgi:hypothetical protein